MLVPFIHALKIVYPESHIDLYTTPMIAKIGLYHEAIDETFVLPKIRQSGKLLVKPLWSFSRELRKKGYTVSYFTNDYMFWPLVLAGVKTIIQEQKSIGFRLRCIGTPHAARRDNLRHAAERHVNNIEHAYHITIPKEDYNFELSFPQKLIQSSYSPQSPYVYLSADGHSVKKYHSELYQRVCQYLLDQGHIVVIDGLVDRFNLDQFQDHPNVHYTVGKTSIFEFFGLVKQCALLVSVDSGPSHVACMFKVKSVIFHPPKANFPFKTAGFFKDNWSYKLSPSDSDCSLACSVFQSCRYDYCETDYVFEDIVDTLQKALSSERSWEEKEFERYQKSVGIALLTDDPQRQEWVKTQKEKGYFVISGREEDHAKTFSDFHSFIKKNRIHIVYVDKKKLSLKFYIWDLWYRHSERAYIKILPFNTTTPWFSEAISTLRK